MSVLIKGMKMPHDCFKCPLSIPPIGDDSPLWMCGGNGMSVHEANTEEHRPFGCPLVEVSEDAVSPCEVCPLVKVDETAILDGWDKVYPDDDEVEQRYCDRNICVTMEVNGKGCAECPVAQNYNLEDDDSPCQNCEVE